MSNFIYEIENLTFVAIESGPDDYPAKRFIQSLDAVGWRDFRVAARILATTSASGRPPAGRVQRVGGSREGLYELRITPRGRRGPHARLLYVREQDTVYCARGVVKRERLSRHEIELAERLVRCWRRRAP